MCSKTAYSSRLLFFSDNGVNPRIEKSSMNGSGRSVIVHTGLIRVLALSADAANDVLYWADYARHTLEACNYDGLRRRVLKRSNGVSVTGLQYYQVGTMVTNVYHSVFLYMHPAILQYSRLIACFNSLQSLQIRPFFF
jgi:hypothetical protein